MKEILSLKEGYVIEFNKVVGESMDVIIGGRLTCRGAIVAIGVYPNPVLRRVEPSVLEILYQMEQRAIGVDQKDPEEARR